ncbi:MAG: inositol monophosphatase [Balneolaceae bacterium]|nr:inositol monophosphatase [Balneolaceae bacterium]
MDYKHESIIAQEAASQAAAIIKEYASKKSFEIELKGKNDLITDADLASEKKIIETIKESFPDDEILAEESNVLQALPAGRVWIIDPIDGTTNFAHGFPVYCISIALWEDNEPRVGLVMEVVSGEVFTAVKGKGAFLNGDSISVSHIEDSKQALIGTGFPYSNLELVDSYLRLFRSLMDNTHGLRRPGSAAWDLCNVACGRFEGFYEYGLSPWDVAAGSLIIQEAGGVVTDWEGADNWLFGKRIIAGNFSIRKFLQSQIHTFFKQDDLSRQ